MAIDPEKLEERIDRAAAGATEVSMGFGGVQFKTMMELMEFAKLMACAGAAVPFHLRGNPGACLAICTRALRFNFDPFSLAEHSFAMVKDQKLKVQKRGNDGSTYEATENVPVETIAYDSYVIRAIINAHAPIEGLIHYAYEGEGDARKCTASAKLRTTGEIVSHTSPTLGERKAAIGTSDKGNLKGSPLWTNKPDVQLSYDTGRDLCRVNFPEVLMGWYDKDELEEATRAATATDVTPAKSDKPDIISRLTGQQGRGFSHAGVEAALEHKPTEPLVAPTEAKEAVPVGGEAQAPETKPKRQRKAAEAHAETPADPMDIPASLDRREPKTEAPKPEPETITDPTELWLWQQMDLADSCEAADDLEHIDDQVCARLTAEKRDDDLRPKWNPVYARNKTRLAAKK